MRAPASRVVAVPEPNNITRRRLLAVRRTGVRLAVGATVMLALVLLLARVAFVMVPGDDAGAAASIPLGTAYSTPGHHPVGTRTVSVPGDRRIDVRLWYPASVDSDQRRGVTDAFALRAGGVLGPITIATSRGDAVRNAAFDLSEGPYPVVVLSPGFALSSSTYGWLAEHLASHGFVVLSPDHDEVLDPEALWQSTVTRPREISTVLDYASKQARPGGAWAGLLDLRRAAALGHSYGGYAAQASAGARLDTAGFTRECQDLQPSDPRTFLCEALLPHLAEMATAAGLDEVPTGEWPDWSDARVKAAVSLAGNAAPFARKGLAALDVPVLAIGGSGDRDTPYAAGARATFDRAASARKVEVGLRDAEHFVFAGRCESVRLVARLVPNGFCSDPGWSRARAHDVVEHYVTAFLLAELRNDAAAAAELSRTEAPVIGVRVQTHGY